MPRCMEIFYAAFHAAVPIFPIAHGSDSVESRIQNGKIHYHGQVEHLEKFPPVPVCLKCVQSRAAEPRTTAGSAYSDDQEESENIIGYAQWYFYDRERSTEECRRETFLNRFEWVGDDTQREKCVEFGAAGRISQWRNVGTRPHGQLRFMCIDEAYRRKGAASAVVRWGLERCAELGIPAYLEASEDGTLLYENLGFEKLATPEGVEAPPFAAMMWTPPGHV